MARRPPNLFSLSFLDIMSCGFGAVVLIFLIINHATEQYSDEVNRKRLAESRLLDEEVTIGEEQLAVIRNTIAELDDRLAETRGRAKRVVTDMDTIRRQQADLLDETLAKEESIRKRQTDLETEEEALERLRAERDALDDAGDAARSFVGEGDRQYLTGIKVGGERILILLDASASMLDETLVNVIRRRNMAPAVQRAAPKWQRALGTVDWVTAQLPLGARFQIYLFNAETRAVLPDTDGAWVDVAGGADLTRAVELTREVVPTGGTSLANAFAAISQLDPLPDNIFLITDSLPTQGVRPPRRGTISGRDRLRLFRDALDDLPLGIPVNTILLPMEGDPMAASAFWQLAQATGGAFMAPARDWP